MIWKRGKMVSRDDEYYFVETYRGIDIVQDSRNGEYWSIINNEFVHRDFVLEELKRCIDDYID